jgi:hypothetical protein
MGIYASFDAGKTWPYSRHTRQVVTPARKMLGSGDPMVAFDRAGVAYASFISFGRDDCDPYFAVVRSADKGVTWTVPVDSVLVRAEGDLRVVRAVLPDAVRRHGRTGV